MKKTMLVWTVLLLTLGASTAWAEKYHVAVKGDCLWNLHRKYNVSVKVIQKANSMGDSTIIRLGQKYVIPESNISGQHITVKHVAIKRSVNKIAVSKIAGHSVRYSSPYWTKPGGNPFRAKLSEGLKIFKFNPEEVTGMVDEANSGKPVYAYAQHISRGGLIIAENGKKYRPLVMLSGGKGNNPIDVKTGPNGVINNWPDKRQLQGGEIYTDGGNSIMIYYKCGNPTLLIEIEEKEIILESHPLPTGNPPAGVQFSGVPISAEVKVKNRDTWDWYDGAFDYFSRLKGKDNNGKGWWTKFRYRPLWFDPTEKVSIGIGAFGFIAGGDGKAAKYYTYNWNERVFGATAKILAEHKDFDIDLGFGRLENHGKWKGEKVNHQKDDIFLAALHGNFYERRDRGEKWFPKFEVNLEGRFPYSTRVLMGEETDNRVVSAMFTQWIYDFKPGADDSLVITPGFNLGAGYEWSSDDEAYVQTGPAVEISSYNNTVAGISLWNYKFQGDGQWAPISAYVSIDGIYNAVQASRIQTASAADLENLPANGESKLLHNPADYLK